MKAISFLEYYRQVNQERLDDDKFSEEKINLSGSSLLYSKNIHYNNSFEFLNDYYELVSQPFSFEKVVKLFEGFEVEGERLIDTTNKIYFAEENGDYNVVTLDRFEHDLGRYFIETIDEFIVLCNNLNIELQWKIENI